MYRNKCRIVKIYNGNISLLASYRIHTVENGREY